MTSIYRRAGKRALDLMVSVPLAAALAPGILALGVLIRREMGSPVLFRQVRPGFRGRPFTVFKFRTMTDERDASGALLPDEMRTTALGRLMRRASLDELPQLINVIRGDMSLVGPRPLLMEYLPRYTPEQARRHDVMPGITGWAQVKGRNALTWEQKFRLDVWYVDNVNLFTDLRILTLTAARVVRPDGINHPGYATMPVFMGVEGPEEGQG